MRSCLPPVLADKLLNHPRNTLLALLILLVLGLTACKRTLLDERFHNQRLDGWTVIDDPDTLEGPSDWRVENDGWVHQRSNIWGLRGDFIGRWYGTYLVSGDAGWSDYTLSLKAKPTDNDGFGVVFRFKDPEHFYRLIFVQDGMSGGPITRLDKRDGADYTELWSRPGGYQPGAEIRIEVEVDSDKINATIDGNQLLDIKDGSYARGKIGLFCYAQSGQAFDDVRVVEH
jgi:3-keto-disaccharide hydrolase